MASRFETFSKDEICALNEAVDLSQDGGSFRDIFER